MKAAILLAAVLAMGACTSSSDSEEPSATVGDIAFSPPPGWLVQELGSNTRVWVPSSNPRKESITIIVGPKVVGDAQRMLSATRSALAVLHDVRVTADAPVTTTNGLTGERFDLTFHPDGATNRLYGRNHIVLIVGDHPVHVIYTAATPDPNHLALDRALASIRKES